jgi:hypothetical protein
MSVRDVLDPFMDALREPRSYIIPGSFTGLPIINQKLAALHPLGHGAFFVTLQGLMQVVQSTRPEDVLAAIAQGQTHSGPPPPPPPPPPPSSPQIGAAFVGTNAGDAGANDYEIGTIGPGEFLGGETVDILDSSVLVTSVTADGQGHFSTVVAFAAGTSLRLSAHGEKSGRVSNTVSLVA